MSLYVILDTGPLGLLTHPHGSPENEACIAWLNELLDEDVVFVIPEVASYELRREYILNQLRTGSDLALEKLNHLEEILYFLPLDTYAVRLASLLWAQVRREGRTTASKDALDGDALLIAQAATIPMYDSEARCVVATTNFSHLSWLAAHTDNIKIAHWRDISLTS